jgi:AcrR family transcriptional regulator
MPTAPTSLRERQAEQVRTAVLDATIALLETNAVDDIVMNDVARASGVSLRTVYRYFPDRADLLQAAGEHLYVDLGVPFTVDSPRDISASFLDAANRLATRPALTRALVQTTAGRAARTGTRHRRVAAIRAALAPLSTNTDPDTARWATAVIAHLCSAVSWISITDDSDLDETDAQRAVAWAIDVLVGTLEEQR